MTESSGTGIATRPIEEPLVTWVARPWLRVAKSAVPTHPVAPGDLITYTLTYENYGTDPAYNVQDRRYTAIAGRVRELFRWLYTWQCRDVGCRHCAYRYDRQCGRGRACQGWHWWADCGQCTCTIALIVCRRSETEACDPVSTSILDPHLSASKTASPTMVTQANAPITYTIDFVNDGGGTLTNVVITDVLSTKTTFNTASAECSWSGAGVGGTVTCDVGDLAQGEPVRSHIVVLAASEGLITNVATVDSDQTTPLVTDPPTEVYYSSSGCIPPFSVDFAVSPDPKAGEVITFTASASGDTPLTYAWTFGDTQSGNGQDVYHTYAVTGTYAVRLTVSNACNPSGINVQKFVFVPGSPELAWTPTSLSETTAPTSLAVLSSTLTVMNDGTDNLLWSIAVTPTATSWLSVAVGGPPAKDVSGLNTAAAAQRK